MGESGPRPPAIPSPIRYDAPVVVTGGAGLLGRELVRQLLEGGCRDIRVVDLAAVARGGEEAVHAHRLDIRRDDLGQACRGARTLFHLAACQYHSPLARTTSGLPFFAINVEGTRRVLEAARRAAVAVFIHASTSMVYGMPRYLPIREDHARRPLGPYGRSKLEAERLVEAACGPGFATVIVRPAPLFGPGRTGVVTRLFDTILEGRPILLVGGGRNRQELAAPQDCARLLLLAGREPPGFAVYNCGAASVPTMREWISALVADAGSSSVLRPVPGPVLKSAFRLLEIAHRSPLRREQYAIADRDYWLDTSAARRTLGWAPCRGGVEAALELFRWYRAVRRP